MLKLVGSLKNGPSRLSSRSTSWCMSNHQVLAGCSGAATAPLPSASSKSPKNRIKRANIETVPLSSPKAPAPQVKPKHNLVSKAFQDLGMTQQSSQKQPEKPQKSPQPIEDLLSTIDSQFISYQQALQTITALSKQVDKGKIGLEELEADIRYQKFCQIVAKKAQVENAMKSVEWEPTSRKSGYALDDLMESANVKELPLQQTIQMFCGLAVRQRRPKPLLKALADNIVRNTETLTIKEVADVLYSMAKLNFVDQELAQKLCEELIKKMPAVRQSPIVGSIVTSLGLLRYRDVALMDTLCNWAIKHKDVLRTQDLCALLMTLAVIGYIPENFGTLYEKSVVNLKNTDMIRVFEWIDVVWSLVVLKQASHEQVASVLNDKFISIITDRDDLPAAKKHKLLNINAAAKYLLKDYAGPVLKDESPVMEAPIARLKDKEMFVNSITDALANLFPSREHFRTNVDVHTGFLIDVEFFIDKKMTTLPVDKISEKAKAIRIAVIANYYHDFCLGKSNLLGSVQLQNRLLEAMGYRILDISHTDFHTDDKLLKRISYLNDRIKIIVKQL